MPVDPLLLFSYISFSLFHFSLTMLVTLRMLCACLIFNIQRNYTYTFDLVLTKIILINKAGASYNRPIFFFPVSLCQFLLDLFFYYYAFLQLLIPYPCLSEGFISCYWLYPPQNPLGMLLRMVYLYFILSYSRVKLMLFILAAPPEIDRQRVICDYFCCI